MKPTLAALATGIYASFLLLIAIALSVVLGGCAGVPDDVVKLHAEARIQAEKTEQVRLNTLTALAGGENAGDGARVAGIMAAMQMPRALVQASPASAQRNWADYMMQALGLAVQVHGINTGRDVAIAQSANNRDVSLASYSALHGVAGLIQAPQANITASGDGASTGGAGNWRWEQIGPDSQNQANTTNTSTDNHSSTSPPTVVTVPVQVVNPVIVP